MNGYSYGADNPVNQADPNGAMPGEGNGYGCNGAAACAKEDQQLLNNAAQQEEQQEQQTEQRLKTEIQYRCGGVSTDENCGTPEWQQIHELTYKLDKDLQFIEGQIKSVDNAIVPGLADCETGTFGECVPAGASLLGDAAGLGEGGEGLPTCGGESFTADTLVLTSTGKTEPISALRVGDKVVSANTTTGKNTVETVDAVLVHHDTDLYDLTVKTSHGKQVVHTTANHMIWDLTTHSWTEASKLHTGDRLLTADGTTASADGGSTPRNTAGWMWDLTIDTLHNFYVLAGDTPVLVHNANGPCGIGNALNDWSSQRYQFGNQQFLLDKSNMTHILERHMPAYWDGSVKATQSFFDPSMSISDVQDAIGSVLQQNRDTLIARGSNGMYQIQGTYGGNDYVLGLNNGHIGQFYPGTLQ